MTAAVPLAFHPPLAHVSFGSGPALLMLQGVGLAGGAWRPQVEALGHSMGGLVAQALALAAPSRVVFPAEYLAAADVPALAARVGEIFGRDLADSPRGMFAQLAAMKRFDVSPELQRLAGMRTLVLSAEHDLIAPPRSGRALAALIPGSRYVEVAGAGHAVTLQLPDAVNQLLREHLQQ